MIWKKMSLAPRNEMPILMRRSFRGDCDKVYYEYDVVRYQKTIEPESGKLIRGQWVNAASGGKEYVVKLARNTVWLDITRR